MVGTFYRAASPDGPPFVEEGASVRKGQTLCIIEAMKMMNVLRAERDGRIKAVRAKPGDSLAVDQIILEFA